MYKKIEIFIDGSCIKNPGPGGYGIILCHNNKYKIIKAGYKFTTNNRMELMGAIQALKSLKKKHIVYIYTDSIYVKQGITKWIYIWKKHNWKNSSKKTVKNIDLWKILYKIIKSHIITWKWIKSHSGNIKNEFCDKLAKYISYYPKRIDKEYLKKKKNNI